MNLEELIEQWDKSIYENAEEVDPFDEYCWSSLAVGFALGKGCDAEQASEFEHELLKRSKL